MQTVILCGGFGTRLKEQTEFLPKPLIPIGGIPMVVHIMRWYAKYGFKKFVLALGYKQEEFKKYFSHFNIINNDIKICSDKDIIEINDGHDWEIILSDTGPNTMKGGRLKRIEEYIIDDTFMMTYGDGISDVDMSALLAFHQSHGKMVTITGVHPAPRFGELHHNNGNVISFSEKPQDDGCLMNGGFMVMNRGIFDYLTEDEWCDLEVGPLELIAAKGELMVYHHKGYWSSMDTLKDLGTLQQEWESGKAKWRVG
jgi:glucose-1-phosphate cytidylyltransferase